MSDNERPDLAALRELSQLIALLGEEAAGWRKRALAAEGRVKDLEASGSAAPSTKGARVNSALERENTELKARLDTARDRVETLLERTRFLRQQAEKGATR